jgi:hypothetical protein
MKPELVPAARQFLIAKYRQERGVDRDPTDQELTEWALLKWKARRSPSDSMSSQRKGRTGGQ